MGEPKTIVEKRELNSLSEFQTWAQNFSKNCENQTIILLKGKLGAGKTEFVRSFARGLGLADVVSPTFALHHRYATNPVMDHWDLYRLESEDDLESSGFWDQFQNANYLILIEWPERLNREWLPKAARIFEVEIGVGEGNKRSVTITN